MRSISGLSMSNFSPQNVRETKSSSNATLVPTVEPTIGDYVGAVYGRKAYIGMVNDMDEDEAEIYFLSHNGRLNCQTKFNSPKKQTMFGCCYQIYSALYQNPRLRSEARLKCVRKNVTEKFEHWLKLY